MLLRDLSYSEGISWAAFSWPFYPWDELDGLWVLEMDVGFQGFPVGLPQNGTAQGQAGGTWAAQRCPGMRHQTIHGRRDPSAPRACFEWDEKPEDNIAALQAVERVPGDLVCPTQWELGWLWPPAAAAAAGARGFLAKQGFSRCGSSLFHVFWRINMQRSKC